MTDRNKLHPSKFRHEGSDSTAPYPVSRMAPSVELVDLAKEISEADQMLSLQVNNKLSLISNQIKGLQNAARQILETAQRDQMLNQAACNFKKIPGKIYHLYDKSAGKQYISQLSPKDWQNGSPHKFIGSFRFEADFSWTPADEINTEDQNDAILSGLIEMYTKKN